MSAEEESAARMQEIQRLRKVVSELTDRLNQGHNYLMVININKITVEDTLEAFGFDRER